MTPILSSSPSSGVLVPFSALIKQVPPPFDKEFTGGAGQVIHDKFIVIDFNDANPVVFTELGRAGPLFRAHQASASSVRQGIYWRRGTSHPRQVHRDRFQ